MLNLIELNEKRFKLNKKTLKENKAINKTV